MHAPDAHDKRFSTRVPYAMQVLVLRDGDAWVADVLDLSEGGCGVFKPANCDLQEGNVADLYFFAGAGRAVKVSSRIARVTDRHVGFEYHEWQSVPPGAG